MVLPESISKAVRPGELNREEGTSPRGDHSAVVAVSHSEHASGARQQAPAVRASSEGGRWRAEDRGEERGEGGAEEVPLPEQSEARIS